ncbi:Hypothetical_protein [Hexamita inflata]|uniref:Hypothetical_protein n=1 Tax=Hexamita inflata TaxID=28002 RepID=A0AA86U251_9EUKA|nr:Hypothetical protein HINF_LOCUS24796 [Hexamita inflata]
MMGLYFTTQLLIQQTIPTFHSISQSPGRRRSRGPLGVSSSGGAVAPGRQGPWAPQALASSASVQEGPQTTAKRMTPPTLSPSGYYSINFVLSVIWRELQNLFR